MANDRQSLWTNLLTKRFFIAAISHFLMVKVFFRPTKIGKFGFLISFLRQFFSVFLKNFPYRVFPYIERPIVKEEIFKNSSLIA